MEEYVVGPILSLGTGPCRLILELEEEEYLSMFVCSLP
jgi:hypothetical protein